MVRWVVVIGLALMASSACFTPQELRKRAEDMPDPRQLEADKVWAAILTVVKEQEQWPVELARREDLLLATEWMPVEEDLRKRVRFTVIIAPMGIGINVLVKHQRKDPQAPFDEAWKEAEGAELSAAEKREEGALVKRVQTIWMASRN